MRCSVLLPITLVVSTSASLVLPFAASVGWQITRRQNLSTCSNKCDTVTVQVNSCGIDQNCVCTVSIAKGLQTCTACALKADPDSAQMLQSALDQYATACASGGHSVGSLALLATGAASPIASGASASTTSTSIITSVPALATSTSSFGASLSSTTGTQSVLARVSSSTPAPLTNQPTVTPTDDGLVGSGNGAAGVGAPMTGAFLVAGIVAAFAVL